jgi:hypothetical protein
MDEILDKEKKTHDNLLPWIEKYRPSNLDDIFITQ